MIRNVRSKTLVALITPALGLGMLAGASLAAEMEQFTLVERAASDAVVDNGAEGDSAGDILAFANEMYDEANETKVGTNNGYCIRTVVGVGWECTFSVALADGQLNVEGPFLESGDSVMSVIGGTGKYSGASGEMGLQLHDDTGTAYDFIFTISY
jgi:hypothetical protein